MHGDERGQITVFLSMAFLVMTVVIFCVLEGIHGYMGSSLAEEAFEEAGDDVLANYDRYLFDKYHVFFLDPRERDYIESDGKDYLDRWQEEPGYYGFSCSNLAVTDEKTAVDEKGLFLRYQISEYMKGRTAVLAGQELNKLVQSAAGLAGGASKEEEDFRVDPGEAEHREETGEDGQEEEISPEDAKHRATWSELKNVLTQLAGSGILLYVIDEPSKIPSSAIKTDSLPSKVYGKAGSSGEGAEKSLSFDKLGEWLSFLKSNDLNEISSLNLTENAFLMEYLFECYSHYGDKEPSGKTALRYELEYLIAAKDTDRANLRSVVDRILLIRFLVNYAYASQDGSIQARAELMSEALAGFLGFPEGQKAVQVLLTAALSFGESVLELHALMNGGKVALVKNSSNWNLSFINAAPKLISKAPVKSVEAGICYEDYLKLFLGMKMSKDIFLYRMMDVMQLNAALEEPGFLMSECLFSYEWETTLRCPRWFAALPGAGNSQGSYYSLEMNRLVGY